MNAPRILRRELSGVEGALGIILALVLAGLITITAIGAWVLREWVG